VVKIGKIAERFMNWIQSKYAKKDIAWERGDQIIWGFWSYLFPTLIAIPLLFWLMKWFVIDILLAKRGFEEMVAYGIIILVLRPMIFDLIHKFLEFRKNV